MRRIKGTQSRDIVFDKPNEWKFNNYISSAWLQNVGPHFETWNAGVLGPVTLYGLNEGRRDLTWQNWSYKVCLFNCKLLCK